VHPEQSLLHADQIDVPHEPLGLLHAPLMSVMKENKLKTNEQLEEQEKVKKVIFTKCDGVAPGLGKPRFSSLS
jgi:hypothetical protein